VATINGKTIAAHGSISFRSGDIVDIPGALPITVRDNLLATLGITVAPGQHGGLELSVNGLLPTPDALVTGDITLNNVSYRVDVYARRLSSEQAAKPLYELVYLFLLN
jgi:hypothetical protein